MPPSRRDRQRHRYGRRGWLIGLVLLSVAGAAGVVILEEADLVIAAVLAAIAVVLLVEPLVGGRSRRDRSSEAEVHTAAALRRLDADLWRTFHDVRFSGFAVDHVAIGPAGILAIESRWADRDWRIEGDRLEGADDNPLHQAQRNATWVRKVLRSKDVQLSVVPILIIWGPGAPNLPGGSHRCGDVVVLNGDQDDEWRADLDADRLASDVLEDAESAVAAFITARKRHQASAAARA